MWPLETFGIDGLESYSQHARTIGATSASMEDVAQRIVGSLYREFTGTGDEGAFALVRLYKTHGFHELEPALQHVAAEAAGGVPADTLRCLTLLATLGDESAWCDRRRSEGHRAIPLVSSQAVAQLPMVARLFGSLGLPIEELLEPDQGDSLAMHHRRYDVFYVPEAAGSPWVPAQDFVRAHAIRSVLGCGGVLPSGDLFAVIGFAKVLIPEAVAELFSSVAMAYKAALVPFTYRVFEPETVGGPGS